MKSNTRFIVAERLRILRKERNLSFAELAQKTGLSASSLSAWERGKVRVKLRNLIVLVDFYNVKMDFLLGLIDEH